MRSKIILSAAAFVLSTVALGPQTASAQLSPEAMKKDSQIKDPAKANAAVAKDEARYAKKKAHRAKKDAKIASHEAKTAAKAAAR